MSLLRRLTAAPQQSSPADAPLPVAHETPPSYPADTAAVHVLAQDGVVRLDDGQLLVRGADGAEARLRLGDVAQVSLHGLAAITTPCVMTLMGRGIPVVYRTVSGYYAGQTIDLAGALTATRRAHYAAAADPVRRIAVARAIVTTKLTNARYVLRRRSLAPATVARLATLVRQASVAEAHASLLGIEGSAAALYFAAMPDMIAPGLRASFPFAGRRRRPPTDPLNALLSYLYAVLTGECATALLAAGLDPMVGFLHVERAGRPALALDLVEPLRPLVADTLAMGLINRGELAGDHFTRDGDAVRLTDAGRRIVLTGLERRMNQSDLRRRLAADANGLATALRRGTDYVPALAEG